MEKPGATSMWPGSVATNASSKNMTRTAKLPSIVQKSNLSTKPGIEKMATSSVKLKTQRSVVGPPRAEKTQAVSLTHALGTVAKRRIGAQNLISIQRTRNVPDGKIETPKIEEQDVELLMAFDETESISTASIEEHLQERLPDPIDMQSVDVNSKPLSSQEEYKNENIGDIHNEDLNACDNADVGINSDINILKGATTETDITILKEATSETELKEATYETELNEDVTATKVKESVDVNVTKLKEVVNEAELHEAKDESKLTKVDCETVLKEAASETELKDAAAAKPKLIAQDEAKSKEVKIMLPAKTVELAQRWRKDDGRHNEVTEEGRSKVIIQEKKNKVMALVGRFETAMSGRE